MSNEYYQPGADRASKVNELFNRIARRYDFINDFQSFGLHRLWKRWLWKLSRPKPGDRVLDLCCGTGDIAFLFAKKGCDVTALDFSEEMLRVARERQDESKSKVKFIQGDAMKTGLPDEEFDVLTIGYGLRNLADCDAALTEMKRVLKPGGQILVLEFGKPDNSLIRALYYGFLKLAVPTLGFLFAGDSAAYAYILESLKHYPAQRGVDEKLKTLGMEKTSITNFCFGAMSINSATKTG
ncbi:MAG: bifunctional demethylmenaquinone methyltransferase/2-methoxy-6-polyprenyl-1,4-benzoquinol methylase UbiE [Limisphaerales bacterium]